MFFILFYFIFYFILFYFTFIYFLFILFIYLFLFFFVFFYFIKRHFGNPCFFIQVVIHILYVGLFSLNTAVRGDVCLLAQCIQQCSAGTSVLFFPEEMSTALLTLHHAFMKSSLAVLYLVV